MFANGQQKMFAHLSNLSITSAAFDREQRDATKTQVTYFWYIIVMEELLVTDNF